MAGLTLTTILATGYGVADAGSFPVLTLIVDGTPIGTQTVTSAGHSFTNNIADLGTGANSAAFIQPLDSSAASFAAMYNNVISGNIITSDNADHQVPWESYGSSLQAISSNLYWDFAGGAWWEEANGIDSAQHYGDPLFTNKAAGNYSLQPGSAAAQINFQPITRAAMGLAPTTAHWYA